MLTTSALPLVLAQASDGQSTLLSMLPIVLMFVVLYFLMIRPQQKRAKEHKAMVEALGKGDEVVTSGGLLGKVADVSETYVTLDVARSGDTPVQVLVQKVAVQSLLPKGTIKAL